MIYIAIFLLAAAAAVCWFVQANLRGKPAPVSLRIGQALPDFSAENEDGETVRTTDLHGKPAVLLFLRGNWCPFCNRQVEDLTQHYKEITDLGARLIFVTPKPLATTRRVADIFGVQFEFWLDPELTAAKQLGLVHTAGVPGKHRDQFGTDTVWPTSIVTNAEGVITYVAQSRRIVDRPNSQELMQQIRKLVA